MTPPPVEEQRGLVVPGESHSLRASVSSPLQQEENDPSSMTMVKRPQPSSLPGSMLVDDVIVPWLRHSG
jgi:hypothetical protein